MKPLVAQMVKNPPTMQETWVQSLGQEDPLEKGMAIHSSILAWRIPWTEELLIILRPKNYQVQTQHPMGTLKYNKSMNDKELMILNCGAGEDS